MSENFLKFKRRLNAIRTVRAALVGVSSGLLAGGVWLILTKLAILGFEPISSLFIGIGVALIVGGLTFLFGGRSDKSLAEELDSEFGLKARVQTMIEYREESGEMISLQRQDTDSVLSDIPIRSYKFKGLPIYIIALVLSAAVLAGGFIVKDMRDYVPPEEIIPFELTELQEKGIEELIKYVENSGMEEEFKTPIADELSALLERLRLIDTQNDMRAALAESMAIITDVTYRSSTSTEMLNALWDSGEVYFKHLAKMLDTSSWNAPDWSDFAEKTVEYIAVLTGEKDESEGALVGTARVKLALDNMERKLDIVLTASGLAEDDEMYLALCNLFSNEEAGLSLILDKIDSLSDTDVKAALEESFNVTSGNTFDAISLNRVNAATGEYAMTRLASLFLVPIPEFERPEFVKNNESPDGGKAGDGNDDKENGNSDGGLGEGATYGSKDLVLDPLTGKYVEYGTLIDTYNALMLEKLENGSYTEEQKTAIRKYFELLYSGIEKEEGK